MHRRGPGGELGGRCGLVEWAIVVRILRRTAGIILRWLLGVYGMSVLHRSMMLVLLTAVGSRIRVLRMRRGVRDRLRRGVLQLLQSLEMLESLVLLELVSLLLLLLLAAVCLTWGHSVGGGPSDVPNLSEHASRSLEKRHGLCR